MNIVKKIIVGLLLAPAWPNSLVAAAPKLTLVQNYSHNHVAGITLAFHEHSLYLRDNVTGQQIPFSTDWFKSNLADELSAILCQVAADPRKEVVYLAITATNGCPCCVSLKDQTLPANDDFKKIFAIIRQFDATQKPVVLIIGAQTSPEVRAELRSITPLVFIPEDNEEPKNHADRERAATDFATDFCNLCISNLAERGIIVREEELAPTSLILPTTAPILDWLAVFERHDRIHGIMDVRLKQAIINGTIALDATSKLATNPIWQHVAHDFKTAGRLISLHDDNALDQLRQLITSQLELHQQALYIGITTDPHSNLAQDRQLNVILDYLQEINHTKPVILLVQGEQITPEQITFLQTKLPSVVPVYAKDMPLKILARIGLEGLRRGLVKKPNMDPRFLASLEQWAQKP